MIDSKTVELINKDIDGMLSPKESLRLKERLSTDPGAKNYHSDLTNLSEMLNRVTAVDPDPNLKKTILNAIPINKYQSTKTKKPAPTFLKALKSVLDFRLAFAFTFGLVAGIFIYSMLTGVTVNDNSNLIGTVLLNKPSAEFKPADRIEINSNVINGTLTTKSAKGVVLLLIDLSTHPEMELVVEFDENDLSFAGFRPQKYAGGQINVSSNKLRFFNRGLHKYILVFEDSTPAISHLLVRMFTDELLYERTLTSRRVTNK